MHLPRWKWYVESDAEIGYLRITCRGLIKRFNGIRILKRCVRNRAFVSQESNGM